MPRLSILIPWLGQPQPFEATLVSVLQHRPADCEVVVAHVPAYDDPYALGDEVRLIHTPQQSTLAGLINATLPQLGGEIIHLLGCGVEVTEHWTEPTLAHFHDPEVAAVAPLVRSPSGLRAGVAMSADGCRRVVTAASVSEISSLEAEIIGPSIEAGFYHRDVLLALDGFDEQVGDANLDLDLGLAISDLGLRTVLEPSLPLSMNSNETFNKASGVAAGAAAERFYRRHAESCSGGRMVHLLSAMARDAACLPRSEAFTRPIGRLLAWLESNPSEQHAQRVVAAAAALEQVAAETLSLEAARQQRGPSVGHSQRRAA